MVHENQVQGSIMGNPTLMDDVIWAFNKIQKMESDMIKTQFKYDIALNMVRNTCADYYIDTLRDNSGIESTFNSAWNSTSLTIK